MKCLHVVVCAAVVACAKFSHADFVEWKPLDGGNGHKYMIVQDLVSGWNSARATAHSLGGELVTITSAGEQSFVESLLASGSFRTGFYWLGLYEQPLHEGDYRWVTDEPLGYTNWDGGEPNNFLGLENRGTMLWSRSSSDWTFYRRGRWNDAGEGVSYNTNDYPDLARAGYVVEMVPSPSTSLPVIATGVLSIRRRRRNRR